MSGFQAVVVPSGLKRDGRKRVLRITKEGSRTVAAAAPHVRRLGQRLLAQFDEQERAQFLDYLSRVGDQNTRG